ncbi:MAG: 6-phosphogluconolactonase [Gemmatimonadaceae bacterium]
MPRTSVRIFPTPDAIGDYLAPRLLTQIAEARAAGRRFVLGCPTGRTPRPLYRALAELLLERPVDLSHVVLVMMDEYLVRVDGAFDYASATEPWSCHHFVRVEIVEPINRALSQAQRLREDSIWFPEPSDPGSYDRKIVDAGGIDFFILASGASDGHVAFNPPGSKRDSRTRIVELCQATRRDNLRTFPEFGALEAVPTHGISVGIATILSARESAMLVWGSGKRETFVRIASAEGYDPEWPATLIHECPVSEIIADADAGSGSGISAIEDKF